jgi:hypothetical protein
MIIHTIDPFNAKPFLQCGHWCGFLPVWMLICWSNWFSVKNALSQTEQLYRRPIPWINFMWLVKPTLTRNVFVQPFASQAYGFTPVWILSCCARCEGRSNFMEHLEQACLFSLDLYFLSSVVLQMNNHWNET